MTFSLSCAFASICVIASYVSNWDDTSWGKSVEAHENGKVSVTVYYSIIKQAM